MHYSVIKTCDVANGPGCRTVLFVSGCRHHCKGCFNPEQWSFDYGTPFTDDTVEEIVKALDHDYITGLSLLGGEPMEPENQAGLLPFLREFKEKYPKKDIWLFSGNLYEELTAGVGNHPKSLEITPEILSYVDILVDGRFVEEKKRLGLRFRGSENQRIIDMNKTREAGEIVIWDGVKLDKHYN